MRKVRYSIIVLAIIIVLIFISMRAAGLSFSQENVHKALERSQHFGPSDENLLKYTGKDGKGIVIGKCGDEGLSVTHTKRYLGVLYKVDTDVLTGIDMAEPSSFIPCEKEISIYYSPDKDLVYGICYDDETSEITLTGGTENDEFFSKKIDLDKAGFFFIPDVSSLYDEDEVSGKEPPYYFYAESTSSIEGTDIRVSSNLTKGQIIDREELNKIIPDENDFMSPDDMNNIMTFTGDELNKINAGIKKYTGTDFFAIEGWADGDTVTLVSKPILQTGSEMQLVFEKRGDRFVPRTSDENMDAAAVGWFMTNYGRAYNLDNIHSVKVWSKEDEEKKQYLVMLDCGMIPKFIPEDKQEGIKSEIMNVEVIVEAEPKDPAKPWKMYYLDGLAGKPRDIDELYIDGVPDGEISDDMIYYFNKAFGSEVQVSQGHVTSTEISCFFTSFYDDPREIDICEFLKYCPIGEIVEDEEEYQKVRAASDAGFLTDTLDEMRIPVRRYRREDVDALLSKYADITAADLAGRGMDSDMLIYVESTDSFYNFTSDFGPGTFEAEKGEKEGSVYYLRNKENNCLTVRRTDEGLKILSFTEN